VLERDPQSPPSAAITALLTLADAQVNQAKIADAEHSYRLAMDKTLARNGPEHQDTLHVQARLGAFLHRTSRRTEGRQLLASVHAQSRKGTYIPEALRSFDIRVTQGLLADGRFDAAEALVDALVAGYRDATGGQPNTVLVNALRMQADQRLGQGRYAQAEGAADEAWAILSKDLRPEQRRQLAPAVALTRARIALAQGDASAALRWLEDSARPDPATRPASRLEDVRVQAVRSDALLRLGRDAQALQTAQAAVDVVSHSDQRGYYAWIVADALLSLGRALRRAGRAEAACSALRQGVALRTAMDDPHSPHLAEAEAALADCLLDAGERTQAAGLIPSPRGRTP
jgi:tetratricopeptide (TPR) repeat protein